MRSFLKAIILLILLCQYTPSQAGKCTGSAYCSACKNCSACKHCNGGGGTCGVCGGGDSYIETPKSNSPEDTKVPDYNSNDYNAGNSYEPAAPSGNTPPAYTYPAAEKKGSHTLIWVLLVLIILYLVGKRQNKRQG